MKKRKQKQWYEVWAPVHIYEIYDIKATSQDDAIKRWRTDGDINGQIPCKPGSTKVRVRKGRVENE